MSVLYPKKHVPFNATAKRAKKELLDESPGK
jgi:hypothetical protein